MKSLQTIILIGGIHLHHKPTCGETMKNQLFLERFNELFETVIPIDTYKWEKHPWCLVRILIAILFHPKANFIISASGASRLLINFLYFSHIRRNVYFWVVGGNLPSAIKEGRYNISALNNLVHILVQGESMVEDLLQLGVKNAIYVPNSKPIIFKPEITAHKKDEPYRFAFLSRIHPDKGIKEIVEASELLNSGGFKNKYIVDFYGTVDSTFSSHFNSLIESSPSLQYKGYLDLTSTHGYEILSKYDIMLFPTYWNGEGFPGVILDANIAGLPVIASCWNLNTEVIEDGETGIIIPPKNSNALFEAMRDVLIGNINLLDMKRNCVAQAQFYDFRKVLSVDLMKKLNLY